jgi:hypothetical protein
MFSRERRVELSRVGPQESLSLAATLSGMMQGLFAIKAIDQSRKDNHERWICAFRREVLREVRPPALPPAGPGSDRQVQEVPQPNRPWLKFGYENSSNC